MATSPIPARGPAFNRHGLTGTGCKTQGVALVNKIRMLDLAARKARKVERVPHEVIAEAIGRLTALLD